jgi:hypothetical protein
MATRGAAQLQNRPANGGRGGNGRVAGAGGDDDASSVAQWAVAGMVFFGIVCFVCLPISAFILMEAKKTNVTAQDALAEAKKIRSELKPKDQDE